MKTNKNTFAPVATLMTLFVLLAITLSACGSVSLPSVEAPQYGKISTPTVAPTPTATPLPFNGESAAKKFVSEFAHLDSTEKIGDYVNRVCALADRNGCNDFLSASGEANTIAYNYKHYKIKTDAKILGTKLMGSGVLVDNTLAADFDLPAGSEIPWEAWEVRAKYTHPWPGGNQGEFSPVVRVVWCASINAWLFDGLDAPVGQSLQVKVP